MTKKKNKPTKARSPRTPKPSRAAAISPDIDKYTLYELCAQNPARDAKVLSAIYTDHAGQNIPAPVLGEDFAGTAALSAAWCEQFANAGAIAVDHAPEPAARAHQHPKLTYRLSDVMRISERVDLIAVLNFSICEIHTRERLIAYLAHARARLPAHGCLICDLYGGSDAYFTGKLPQKITVARGTTGGWRGGERVTYTWEQREANPLTGRVVNAMHFAVEPPTASKHPAPKLRLNDAFIYDWRLWSVPELRDAMTEAGFATTQVYPRTADAIDNAGALYLSPVEDAQDIADAFNVFIVGRAG